ncbi:MAG: hypothetical protein ACJ756_06455, partial [Solirubrobacterales bacterium]
MPFVPTTWIASKARAGLLAASLGRLEVDGVGRQHLHRAVGDRDRGDRLVGGSVERKARQPRHLLERAVVAAGLQARGDDGSRRRPDGLAPASQRGHRADRAL